MKRATACAMLLLLGSLAVAADESDPKADANAEQTDATKSIEDELPAIEEPPADITPISGVRYKVVLKTGRAVKGVVRSTYVFERWSTEGGYEEAEFEHPKAGIRLWFPGKQHGFIFVKVKEIETLTEQGELTEAEGIKLARRQHRAEQVAKRDRERRRLRRLREIAERRAAEAGAAEGADSEETSKSGGLTKKQESLLLQFPPGEWTPETPEEINRRKVVLGLFPSKAEKDFLAVFDEWKKAHAVWKALKAEAGEVADSGK